MSVEIILLESDGALRGEKAATQQPVRFALVEITALRAADIIFRFPLKEQVLFFICFSIFPTLFYAFW